MYLDAVFDEEMNPVFNDTPENVKDWLEKNPDKQDLDVCIGRTLKVVSARDYLKFDMS